MDRCLTDAEILRFLGGQLGPDKSLGDEAHLASCADCSSRLAALRQSPAGNAAMAAQAATRVGATSALPFPSPSTGSHWSDLEGQSAADLQPPPRPASLSLDEFLANLSQSGMFPPPEVAAIREQASREGTSTVVSLIDWLISAQKLTRYQAELIVRGQRGGLILGNYVIQEKLGQGGMGTVFKAKHRRMNRLVAIKVLPSALAGVPEAIARFEREVEAAARLQHPNIAAAFDADEADGVHFLVMEYVEGPTLAAYVKAHGPLPLAGALHLAAQAARGLAAAHERGIVHRDIKPSNLMVNRQGVLKVLDLGLAQVRGEDGDYLEAATTVTQTGRVMGTVDYMAPEQARDAKNVDFRADLYSLGCTLYYLATGQTPAPGSSAAEKLLWHQTQSAPPLSAIVPEASPKLDALVARLMAKEPADRPESMAEVAAQLEACLAELPPDAIRLAVSEVASSDPADSTLWGSRFAQQTLVHAAQTVSSASQLNLPPARRPGRWWMYACGLAGAAGLAVILLAPLWMNQGDPAARVAPDRPPRVGEDLANEPIGITAPQAGPQRLPRTSPATEGPQQQSSSATLPRPIQKFLVWAFANGGQLTIVSGIGQEQTIAMLGQVPDQPFAVLKLRLDGSGIRDADLARLAAVPGLRELSLANTRLTDAGLAHLAPLQQLTHLNLAQTGVTSAGISALVRLPGLAELDLSKTQVTDQGLARLAALPHLVRLNLSDTNLTDAAADQLDSCAGLREILLFGTGLTEAGHARLAAALPSASIGWDGIDRERALAVKLLDKGATLAVLDRRQKMHTAIQAADDLPSGRWSVKRVDLSTAREISDADIAALVDLADIDSLSLAGTGIAADSLAALDALKSLKTLDLGSMSIPPAILAELRANLPECEILLKEPADLAVARLVLALKGRLTITRHRSGIVDSIENERDLPPAVDWSIRAIYLDDVSAADDKICAQLGELPRLESLFLSGTGITDEGVAQITPSRGLRELSLSRTKVGPSAVGALVRLPQLARLYLADTDICSEGTRHAAAIPGLTHLSLSGVELRDDDLALLKRNPSLEWLDLSTTPAGDPAIVHLSELTSLKELHVAGTGVSDAAVEELRLALPDCRIIGDPPDRQRLAARWLLRQKAAVTLDSGPLGDEKSLPRASCRIRAVDAAQTAIPAADAAQHLAACRDVVSLNLSQTALREADLACIANMSELRELRLADLPIRDATLKLLTEHGHLRILDLGGTRVSGSGLVSLASLEELVQLSLARAPLEERSLAVLSKCEKLERLDLSACRDVGDATLTHLANLAQLKSLGLRGTRLTDAGCASLGRLVELEQLDLSSTKVSDAGIANLAGCPKLQHLILARTSVTDAVVATLAPKKSLKRIDLAGCKVSPEAVRTLRAALPDCVITEPIQSPLTDRLSPSLPGNE